MFAEFPLHCVEVCGLYSRMAGALEENPAVISGPRGITNSSFRVPYCALFYSAYAYGVQIIEGKI